MRRAQDDEHPEKGLSRPGLDIASRVETLTLIGESPAMLVLRQDVAHAARTQAKVLVLGETGVGKEVVARLIHAESVRRHRRFVAVNCAGVPETLLESELFGHARGSFTGAYRDHPGLVRLADRGTLFLDELGEMSLRMQGVLLRFAETGEVQPVGAETPAGSTDVRLITATNQDLRAQIDARAFREDLYYRLNVIQIRIPPLRDRGEDARLLLAHYLRMASVAYEMPCPTLSAEAEQRLRAYHWPGNVRELKNLAERLVVRRISGPVTPSHLPLELMAVPAAAGAVPHVPLIQLSVNAPVARPPASASADRLWAGLMGGATFWTVVHQPFKAHDVTRDDVRDVIHRGLQETRGNYRRLLRLFHMDSVDYKRFLAFLYQYGCSLPVQPYRTATHTESGEPLSKAS